MKIIVLGGAGMAGHTISIYLTELGHDVVALTRNKIKYCKNIQCNVTDFDNLKKVILDGKYDAVINAVGILNNYADDNKSLGVLLNSYLPHFLSFITKELPTKIIQMSTDCVFSGQKGGYTENSFRDGDSFYDRSKALGELRNEKDITFRNSIIGPDISQDGIGLFNWFMRQENEIQGFTNVFWTGVTTITLAQAIDQALKENLVGLYNLVNNKKITKFELLKLFNKYFKNNSIRIIENGELKLDKSLVNNRNDFLFEVPDYEQMIVDMRSWIFQHRLLYPHYIL